MPIDEDELHRRFAYHPPETQEKREAHERVRAICRDAATQIVEVTGSPTREQSLAITALEEAMFWANAAVARPREGAALH